MPALLGDEAGDGAVCREALKTLSGGITEAEALFLLEQAEKSPWGWMLEVGSYKGKSAVALYAGSLTRRRRTEPDLYCVDPHESFVGIYGGQFGPEDRGEFYRVMLRTGAYRGTALINLSSEIPAASWQRPLSFLFIDGDHSYAGARRDADAWLPHLLPGSLVVFDDALDPAGGPSQVIKELLEAGTYVRAGGCGKMVALRKLALRTTPEPFKPGSKLRILIATTELFFSGGMLRFERVGRVLREMGHDVFLCVTQENVKAIPSITLPHLSPAEAWRQRWDVTMLPGRAGFDENGNESFLDLFTDERFGLRVQHLLNDRHLKNEFLHINRRFLPHLLVFNNRHWQVGDYTEFGANEFRFLIGAVDTERFAVIDRPLAKPGALCTIGGQARKNPLPLIEALYFLPDNFRVKLFGACQRELGGAYHDLVVSGRLEFVGPIDEGDLVDYFATVDLIVSTELVAGWSNLAAEAMASGVPLLCTTAGTLDLGVDGETAVLLDSLSPRFLAGKIEVLWQDENKRRSLRVNARRHIASFDWKRYALTLLDLLQGGRECHYYHAPTLGLHGKWPLDTRLDGLADIIQTARGKTVLDLGAAEGLIAKVMLDAGAELVHGLEIDPERVRQANQLCADHRHAQFLSGNLSDAQGVLESPDLLTTYDIVLYLGVHQHIPPNRRLELLDRIASRCGDFLAIRTAEALFEADAIDARLLAQGLGLIGAAPGSASQSSGMLRLYRRQNVVSDDNQRESKQ